MRINRLESTIVLISDQSIRCFYRPIDHSRIDDADRVVGEKNVLIAIGHTSLITANDFVFRQVRVIFSDDE